MASNQDQQQVHCDKCDFTTGTAGALNQHQYRKHVGTRCGWPGCQEETVDEEAMRSHLRHTHAVVEVRDPNDANAVTYHCPWPECGKTFSRPHTAQQCLYRHNVEDPAMPVSEEIEERLDALNYSIMSREGRAQALLSEVEELVRRMD
ncbi:hypothetical protein GGR53DRAFT_482093 [Hypoxylon sp. FL1150]|nr:hypothetical protein GGR53DRAFT_482093 [Hypoxylon sp. FL1150]